jgi:hypothetical protein
MRQKYFRRVRPELSRITFCYGLSIHLLIYAINNPCLLWSIQDVVVKKFSSELLLSPTYQQVEKTCDTIFALTANTIFEKLYFSVIISSAIDPKLKRPLLGLPKETYQN